MKEIVTYLMFDGDCRQAMTFYAEALGGRLEMMTAGESGHFVPEHADRILHAKLALDHGTLMASDTMGRPGYVHMEGTNFSVSLDCESAEEQQRFFTALSAGGQVTMPLADTFWGARFGMLTDRFHIHWMLNYDQPQPA